MYFIMYLKDNKTEINYCENDRKKLKQKIDYLKEKGHKDIMFTFRQIKYPTMYYIKKEMNLLKRRNVCVF